MLRPSSWPALRQLLAAPLRGLALGLLMLMVIITVVYPYWHWSITDPITQVSIPHGSRESFLEHPNFGFIFFIIPWGPLLALIPYIVWCAFRTARWPLAVSVLICLLLGTGGTTPIPRLVFGPAYDIITLDRFTFWAVIMTLPFAGAVAASLLSGRARAVLVAAFGKRTTQASIANLTLGYAFVGILVAALPLIKPTQPAALDPQPIVQFMAKDDHQRWRYMTLGFGDQFAYHSALIDALSVDGNYHSARRMPQLMAYSVERLENAKYLGESGLSSLRQVIINAETYNLKYIFSNDAFYDPLLYFAGWTRLVRLSNGVVVWNKPGVKPIAYPLPRQTLPMHKTIMWGTIPPASLFLVFLILLGLAVNNQLIPAKTTPPSPETRDEPNPKIIWFVRHASMALLAVSLITVAVLGLKPQFKADAEATLEQYYIDLDQRDFEAAYAKLDPNVRPDYSSYLKMMRNRGGLVWSYSKLTDLRTERQENSATNSQIDITRTYQTALGPREVTSSSTMIKTEDGWRINSQTIPKAFTHALMIRGTDATVRDLSTTRTGLRGTSAVSFDDPVITASEPVLTNFGDAIRVVGAAHNTSSFPACLNVVATGRFDTDRLIAQRMGILGGHRLAPGETRHYSLEFEGRLQPLQDEPLLSSQPERFRLPGFSANPEHVDVQISTFSCQQDTVSGIVMDDIHVTRDNALQVTLTNYDTKIAGVTKLSLVYFDHDGRPVLIRPHYLETNLIPGEVKTELIPLYPSQPLDVIKPLNIPEINGAQKDHIQSASHTHIKLDESSPFSALSIEIDAMPFIPPQ